MTFELLTIKDFFSYFGNGYCVEMPLDKTKLNKLLNYLSAQEAVWKFYATLINGNWFHGIHVIFPKDKDTDSAMRHICELLGTYSYCIKRVAHKLSLIQTEMSFLLQTSRKCMIKM